MSIYGYFHSLICLAGPAHNAFKVSQVRLNLLKTTSSNFMSLFFILLAAAIGVYYLIASLKTTRQLGYIDRYGFHKAIRSKLLQKYPGLTEQQADKVFEGLRDYFRICHRAKTRAVSMPSKIVDAAWHEFILFTRGYHQFCGKAFGRYLHHTPAEAMRTPTQAQDGIKRAWQLACSLENINPRHPERLPLLFAIDALLQIEHGFIYQLDCTSRATNNSTVVYCASHIGCASGYSRDAGADSDGSIEASDSTCSGGCSGGCGGD
jgi:hypothetical protein